jgi:hypothetical protein
MLQSGWVAAETQASSHARRTNKHKQHPRSKRNQEVLITEEPMIKLKNQEVFYEEPRSWKGIHITHENSVVVVAIHKRVVQL